MKISTAIRSPEWDDISQPTGPVALLLHGYGSHEGDLPGLAPWLPPGMPWVSLRAPLAMPGMGFAWFPLSLPAPPPQQLIEEATDALWEWIDANVVAQAQVVPLGFSQGGLMALQLLRTRPERVDAAVVLAGLISAAPQPADARLSESRPPVFWGRGDTDAVIPPEGVANMAAFLPEHTSLTERIYPGLGHSVDQRMMDDVRRFLVEAGISAKPAGHP